MTPRAWTRQMSNDFGSVTIMPSVLVGMSCDTWESLGNVVQTSLQAATTMAPQMVLAAITALDAQKTSIMKGGGSNADQTEAGPGLVKYFNLYIDQVPKARYLKTLDGINRVYEKIITGFSLYDLVVDSGEGEVKGWVKRKGAKVEVDKPTIRKNFGFDFGSDSGCVFGAKYERERAGRIHLDIGLLGKSSTPKAIKNVARILVHEASHKWAYTTDILYKIQTFSKLGLVYHEEAVKKVILESQPSLTVPGKQKKLLPMTGFEKIDPEKYTLKDNLSVDFIQPERWLENADSYAWFARSMLKDYYVG
jgi:hypothetical protein